MKTFSTPRVLAAVAAAALAGAALVVPMQDAEARKGGRGGVRDHRAPAPVARSYRSPGVGTMKSPGGAKVSPRVGTVKKLTCVGAFCPRERPPAPKATTTGTNKANPNPVTPGSVTIRDHRRPKCSASGHCRPRRNYFYKGQRIRLPRRQ